MSSPFTDLDRPPLRAGALRSALVTGAGLWTRLEVLAESPSTNAAVAEAARDGAAEGLVVVAEAQTAGRGRRGRAWTSPARAGLTFSVLLRPAFATSAWGWLPLLAGLAVADAVARLGELEVGLKWPNDVLVGERKLAGVLAEVVDGAVALGVGLNVSSRPDELPVATATSLAVEQAAVVDRDPVLRAVLRETERRYADLSRAAGDAQAAGLAEAYRVACATLGRDVRVELPGDEVLEGTAVDVDPGGRLVVEAGTQRRAVTAGDVVHLR